MKKLILITVVALAIVSCGPKKTEQTVVNQDSITTVDTVNTEVISTDSTTVDTAAVAK